MQGRESSEDTALHCTPLARTRWSLWDGRGHARLHADYLFHLDVIISKDFFATKALGPREREEGTQISFVRVFELRHVFSPRRGL